MSYWDALAALEWQVELGADEAMLDAPLDRFELPAPVAMPKPEPVARTIGPTQAAAPVVAAPTQPALAEVVAVAQAAAEAADTLDALREAMARFEHCDPKRGARNLVFSDGHASARVMIIGEAPGREEDQAGKPFVGPAGQMLDRMFAAIGLDRAEEGAGGLYITNMLPWRPPQNRDPKTEELAMMAPFVQRHIELAAPDVVVLMGNHACAGLLGKRGITKLRGTWEEVGGKPALPMCHPAYLLRNPIAKRDAWADLLSLKAQLS